MVPAMAERALFRVLREVAQDQVGADVLLGLVPDVVVGDEAERGVAELSLAGELRLGQCGHADDVRAP